MQSLNELHQNDGSDIQLNGEYVLWSHQLGDNNWGISGYKKMCTIRTVSDFWRLFNNFRKIGWKFMNFYLMKSGVDPMWEHPLNRNGGICSFKTHTNNALEVWESLNVKMMCDKLASNMEDINGISISPKNKEWALVKIWNRDSKNDLMVTLNNEITESYKELSIQYKANNPEY
jgi:hypothetical protein